MWTFQGLGFCAGSENAETRGIAYGRSLIINDEDGVTLACVIIIVGRVGLVLPKEAKGVGDMYT